jgi:hypothetical protein
MTSASATSSGSITFEFDSAWEEGMFSKFVLSLVGPQAANKNNKVKLINRISLASLGNLSNTISRKNIELSELGYDSAQESLLDFKKAIIFHKSLSPSGKLDPKPTILVLGTPLVTVLKISRSEPPCFHSQSNR